MTDQDDPHAKTVFAGSLQKRTAYELLGAFGFDRAPSEMRALSTVLVTVLGSLSREAKADLIQFLTGRPEQEPQGATRCNVASANTLGHYSCTREQGHEGPCAAVPQGAPRENDATVQAQAFLDRSEGRHQAFAAVAAEHKGARVALRAGQGCATTGVSATARCVTTSGTKKTRTTVTTKRASTSPGSKRSMPPGPPTESSKGE